MELKYRVASEQLSAKGITTILNKIRNLIEQNLPQRLQQLKEYQPSISKKKKFSLTKTYFLIRTKEKIRLLNKMMTMV
jgi:hypothetical protein